eukprot:555448_1
MSLLHRRRTDSWTVMSIRNCAIAFCIISVIWVESGQPFVLGGVFKKLADNIVTLSNEELMHALPEDANEHVLLIEFQSRLMDIWRSIEAIKVLQSEKSVLDAEENVPEQISKFERFIQRADFREALERDCLTDGTSIVHVYDQYRRLILSLRSFLKHNALQRLLALADVEFNGSPTSDSFEKYRKCVNAVVYYLESKEFQSPYKDQLPISDMVKTNNANVQLAEERLDKIMLHKEKMEKLASEMKLALAEFRDSGSNKCLEKYTQCVDALVKFLESDALLRFPGMSEEVQSMYVQAFKTQAEGVREYADTELIKVQRRHYQNAKKRDDRSSEIIGFIATVCILLAFLCVYRVCAKSEQLMST